MKKYYLYVIKDYKKKYIKTWMTHSNGSLMVKELTTDRNSALSFTRFIDYDYLAKQLAKTSKELIRLEIIDCQENII